MAKKLDDQATKIMTGGENATAAADDDAKNAKAEAAKSDKA